MARFCRTHPPLGSLLRTCIVWVHGESHEGKAKDPFEKGQVPTDPSNSAGDLTHLLGTRASDQQGRQLAGLGSKPHLFQMGKKVAIHYFSDIWLIVSKLTPKCSQP